MDVGSLMDVASEVTTSVDGRSLSSATLDSVRKIRGSDDQDRTDIVNSGSRRRHVTFRRRDHKVYQSTSRSSSRCSSPCVDNVGDRPHSPADRPHGLADRPLSSGDRPHFLVDRPLSVGRDSDGSVKSQRPRRSAFESAVRGRKTKRQGERHCRPDRYGPVSECESASSPSPERCDCRRHECRQDVRESHQRRSLPTRDGACSDVCCKQSHVKSLADKRSCYDEDRRFDVTDVEQDRIARSKVHHSVLPTLKLGHYDGTTCLETFLAKFDNCSDYYSWYERERLCHLRAALDGGAGQVLWDAGKQSSVEEITRLLTNRFGTQNQDERYRAELKARRRRNGETLQAVYHDVRRLMALAFPGQSGSLWEIMARDSFLEALGDSALRLRILEREPSTLDEALKIASRLEALRKTDFEEPWDDLGRRKE